jgi:hypothetical protein
MRYQKLIPHFLFFGFRKFIRRDSSAIAATSHSLVKRIFASIQQLF